MLGAGLGNYHSLFITSSLGTCSLRSRGSLVINLKMRSKRVTTLHSLRRLFSGTCCCIGRHMTGAEIKQTTNKMLRAL